jgi:hypothetical protein
MSVIERPLPPLSTFLTVIDTGARKAMTAARDDIAPIVSRETPRSSGRTAAALRPKVSRTSTGAALVVGAPRGKRHGNVTVAEVVQFVNKGTGLYGYKHRRIRAKNKLRRMTLPGGQKRWSVRGQKPNPFMLRIRDAGTPRVQAAAEAGATETARAVERTVG